MPFFPQSDSSMLSLTETPNCENEKHANRTAAYFLIEAIPESDLEKS
tara:strand:- start:219 stop:359 length:141 start_codon:yes stop_codon:yes gene_type:complete